MSGTMENPLAPAPAPPPNTGSPVVTEGTAGTRRPYEDFFSAYQRMQELNRPAPPTRDSLGLTADQRASLDQLGAFGAALASSRNPSFMGGLGEGFRALQQTAASQRAEARQDRTENRQQQQVMAEAAYRAAQEARQAAEFEYNRDRTNPTNRLRVAQTAEAEARARAALAEIGRGDRVRYDQPVLTTDSQGRQQREYTSPYGPSVVRPLQGNPVATGTAAQRITNDQINSIIRAGQAEAALWARDNASRIDTMPREQAARERAAAAARGRIEAGRAFNVSPEIAERLGMGEPAAGTPAPDVRRSSWER